MIQKWALLLFFLSSWSQLSATAHYWLMEEDYVKLGKMELYEGEKRSYLDMEEMALGKKRKKSQVLAFKDLDKPRYIFLRPLKDLSNLELYSPCKNLNQPMLPACLYFKVYTLFELLLESSFQSDEVFSKARPYLKWALFDVIPGSERLFEKHMEKASKKQKKKSSAAWNCWKVLLGSEVPKYLVYISYFTKEGLKSSDLERLFELSSLKQILRNKKTGSIKAQESLSVGKKS